MRKINLNHSPIETKIVDRISPVPRENLWTKVETIVNFVFQNKKYFIGAITLASISIILLKLRKKTTLQSPSTLFDALDVTPPQEKKKNSSAYLDLETGNHLSSASFSVKTKKFYEENKQFYDEHFEEFLKVQDAFFQRVSEEKESQQLSREFLTLQSIFSQRWIRSSKPDDHLDTCDLRLRKIIEVEAERTAKAKAKMEKLEERLLVAKSRLEKIIALQEFKGAAGEEVGSQTEKEMLESIVEHIELEKAAFIAEQDGFANSPAEKFSRILDSFFLKMGVTTAPGYTSLINTSSLDQGTFFTKPEITPVIMPPQNDAGLSSTKKEELLRNLSHLFNNVKDPNGLYFFTLKNVQISPGEKRRIYTFYEENPKKEIRIISKLTSPLSLFFQGSKESSFPFKTIPSSCCQDVILMTKKVIATGAFQKVKAAHSFFTGQPLVKKKITDEEEFEFMKDFVGMRGHVPYVISRKHSWLEARYDMTLSEAIEDNKISDQDVLPIVLDLLHATKALHKKRHTISSGALEVENLKVSHFDVKLANILFRKTASGKKECVLTDISFQSGALSGAYTATYLAPNKERPRDFSNGFERYRLSPLRIIELSSYMPYLGLYHENTQMRARRLEYKRKLEEAKDKVREECKNGQPRDLWALGLVIASILFRKIPIKLNRGGTTRLEYHHFFNIYLYCVFNKHVKTETLNQKDRSKLQTDINEITQEEIDRFLNASFFNKLTSSTDTQFHAPILKIFEVTKGLLQIYPEDRISVKRAIEILES
ncbi:MAG: hypothetical protein SNF33_08355 [Candidatus Algichlamydia australiensis]|nr:hypothetical protein [Chlamydiales bacterium]